MLISIINGINAQNVLFEEAASIVFYFTIYSFFGWVLENSYNFFTKGIFIKPNFLYGPFKPMYGFAPVLLVLLTKPDSHWVLVLPLCFTIPTLVEYISGVLLQKLFRQQWWDYSGTPMQLHGHICLPFSLCWGVLSLLCLKWIHPAVIKMFEVSETLWNWTWPALMLYFIADLALTVRKYIRGPETISNLDTVE
ncbi:putative ABC transporter permease [Neobacillus sp. SAB-20_R2A]|uniref:putative ABC transporter permease n=1 Tax=Neobacillus sp. SAB-20_R2A TaxID=3120519 RepID=UPI003C6E18A9